MGTYAVRGHAVRMWPSAPKALRAWTACRTRFECRTRFVRWSLTNQKIMSHLYTLWDNCCTRFEDTQLECTFLKYKICTGYIRPTVLGVYMLVLDISLDISCHLLVDECKLDSF